MVLPWVRRIRWLILLGGLALVVTGTVATFVGRLALPAGIAIVVGAAGCLLAAIGQWPASLSWGNASVAFAITNQIRNEIDDVLAEAPAAAKPSLERVRDIVSAVQVDQTPRVAAAIAYDDEIEAALRRVVPDAASDETLSGRATGPTSGCWSTTASCASRPNT